jgi:hypothetical protein
VDELVDKISQGILIPVRKPGYNASIYIYIYIFHRRK